MRWLVAGFLGLAGVSAALVEPASAVTIDWVAVGDPGNAAAQYYCDAANCGSVAYTYYISKYEVTNAQYAEFLNSKAASDPLALYNPSMGSDPTFGGITRNGVSGSYTYTVNAGFANKPVTYVSFYDSLRFANWLNNAQGTASTETGAYTLLGGTATPSNGLTVTRDSGANIFLTSENEWYKAAYYSPGGVYFFYPTGSNDATSCVAPGADTGNSANCSPYPYAPGSLTNVGAYALSASPYGTFDQGGNVFEWNEQIVDEGTRRSFRGGAWTQDYEYLSAGAFNWADPSYESADVGFRVASLIPEPETSLLMFVGLVGAAARRRRRSERIVPTTRESPRRSASRWQRPCLPPRWFPRP